MIPCGFKTVVHLHNIKAIENVNISRNCHPRVSLPFELLKVLVRVDPTSRIRNNHDATVAVKHFGCGETLINRWVIAAQLKPFNPEFLK